MASVLDLHHYEALIGIVEAGSVTGAARRLWLSQSAVSHRLAEAERRLGHPLFERRSARPLRPTPAARALYQAARRALPALRRAESDFLRTAGAAVDVVRIGVVCYDCYHWLTPFSAFAGDELPDIALELVVVSGAPATRLAQGAVNVVLAPGTPDGPVAARPLLTDELVLLVDPSHPLAGARSVEAEALEEATYLTWSRTPAPGFEYERFFRPAGVAPRTVTVVEHTNAIAEMVASGLGVSILSRWTMSPFIASGKLVAVRCGAEGLALPWHALLRPEAAARDPEMRVADALARWLAAP